MNETKPNRRKSNGKTRKEKFAKSNQAEKTKKGNQNQMNKNWWKQ